VIATTNAAFFTVLSPTELWRAEVVREACSWCGTPYHMGNAVKGAGCDCGSFLLGVYHACGLITDEAMHDLTGDWWNHASQERYLLRVMRHARKVLEAVCYASIQAKPGNIVMTKIEDTQRFNHGAIVTRWPMGVHAVAPHVCEVNLSLDPMWAYRPIQIYDPWEKPE
jgi:cell wall-associated NlpC family hydrolase